MNIEQIKAYNTEIFKEIVENRRYFHQNPELSYCEVNTAKVINQKLQEIGIETDLSFGNNNVIGILPVNSENKFLALRADIDALPILEENISSYTSNNHGVMHACGHDAHIASLLGTAKILKKFQSELKNNILFIFQAAEEKNPGGAKILLDSGLLSKYNISKIIAQHIDPEIESGKIALGKGNLMASCDEIYAVFNGIGGHAAQPDKRSDTVLATINFIQEIDQLKTEINKQTPTLISFGKIIANGATNIVPAETSIAGTMRTYNENNRCFIKSKLQITAEKWAKKYNCSVALGISEGYPCLINDEKLFDETLLLAEKFVGKNNILEFEARMGAEDFSFYSHKIPALLYRTGVKGNGFGEHLLHNSKFDLDENVFLTSCGFMALLCDLENET